MTPKRKSTDTKAAEAKDPAIEAKAAAPKKAKGAVKLNVGDNVSKVSAKLLTNDEREVTLSELTKETGIICFTYPRCSTPGCTKQGCGFRDNYSTITSAGFEVYGMSFDKPKSQTNWKIKQNFPYTLLTDTDGDALKAFGCFKLPKNVIRSHFIIAKGGEVLEIRNQISPADSFNEAVKFVTSLKK